MGCPFDINPSNDVMHDVFALMSLISILISQRCSSSLDVSIRYFLFSMRCAFDIIPSNAVIHGPFNIIPFNGVIHDVPFVMSPSSILYSQGDRLLISTLMLLRDVKEGCYREYVN